MLSPDSHNLLTIDIGNTNIRLAVFRGSKLIHKFVIKSENYTATKVKAGLRSITVCDAMVSSVAPSMAKTVTDDLRALIKGGVFIAGNTSVPIKNRYRSPKQTGCDRLLNAYAAAQIYGAPAIICSFGTACTIEVVSRKKEYLGGFILAGLKLSLDALSRNTKLLPALKLEKPTEFIGRDTKNCMLSGLLNGYAALTDGLIRKIKLKIGKDAIVVGTGGDIRLIRGFCRQIDRVDEDLTVKGLAIIYWQQKSQKFKVKSKK